jgi:hypothetical protein
MLTLAELEHLSSEEKYGEAFEKLRQSLQEALTPEERTEAAVELAFLYAKVTNALAGEYLSRTAEIDALIAEIEKKEKEIANEAAIAKIKEHISKL